MFTATGVSRHECIADAPKVREGTSADLNFAAQVDRTIRRGAHGPDLEHLLGRGSTFLIVDDRSYALAGESGPQVVAALDGDAAAAADLLRAGLCHCEDGADVAIPRIGAGHQWALQVALEAGLTIAPGGALAIRNDTAPSAAYLPDNVFC
jgi:hypothetical protein